MVVLNGFWSYRVWMCLTASAAAVLVIGLTWIGYRGYADDVMTIRGAQFWLLSFPYLGETHWELRHPYVFAVAGGIGLLGLSETSVLAVNVLSVAAVTGLVCSSVSRWSGPPAATIAVVLLLAAPVFAFAGSIIAPGAVELLFVLSSILLFIASAKVTGAWQRAVLMAAGLLLGLAFSVRETSVALVLIYAGAFILGVGIPRRKYMWLLVGFVMIVAFEIATTWVASGDPWYRYRIDVEQHHPWAEIAEYDFASEVARNKKGTGERESEPLPADSSRTIAKQPAVRLAEAGSLWTTLGSIIRGPNDGTPPLPIDFGKQLNPYASLLVNHEFGALFWVFVPALFLALFSSPIRRAVAWQVWLFVALGLVWFLVQTYVIAVRPHPRYFLPTVLSAAILNGTVLWRLLALGREHLVAVVILGSVFVGMVAYDLQGEKPRTERLYVEALALLGEPIATSEELISKSRFFLVTSGVEDLATPCCSESTNLIFAAGDAVDLWESLAAGSPRALVLIKEWESRPRFLGMLLKRVGVLERLPGALSEKLYLPDPVLRLYRVTAE